MVYRLTQYWSIACMSLLVGSQRSVRYIYYNGMWVFKDRGLKAILDAHELLLRETKLTLSTLQSSNDLGITADMTALFRPLGIEMYGEILLGDDYL